MDHARRHWCHWTFVQNPDLLISRNSSKENKVSWVRKEWILVRQSDWLFCQTVARRWNCTAFFVFIYAIYILPMPGRPAWRGNLAYLLILGGRAHLSKQERCLPRNCSRTFSNITAISHHIGPHQNRTRSESLHCSDHGDTENISTHG